MPLFHSSSRNELRRMYVAAWRKRQLNLPAEPLETQIADVVGEHPEYHAALAKDDALEQDYSSNAGAPNPFLHMGLHLAVRDQIATDRPPGIRAAFALLASRSASPHDAEHVVIDYLAEALWNAQRSGSPPDEAAYLARVRSAGTGR